MRGADVVGLMFKRVRNRPDREPSWLNIDLGATVDRNYLERLPHLAAALATILRHKSDLADCDVLYARNIDMLLLAVATKLLLRLRTIVVYEVLDVQRVLLRENSTGRLMRWAERWLMTRCAMLVVSSPEFVNRYFAPIQRYSGQWRLIENKVGDPLVGSRIPVVEQPHDNSKPWVIGWYGVLRCVRSLGALAHIADTLGPRVEILIRGMPSYEDLTQEQIAAACASRPNMKFGGPYRSPEDLPQLYGTIDFAWCVDYLDVGKNSDWLLPNRIYEGGLFAALALARRNTATGRKIEAEGLGWALDEPLEQGVITLLESLTSEAYSRARRRVLDLPTSMFVDLTDTSDLLKDLFELSDRRQKLAGPGGTYPLGGHSEDVIPR